MIEAKDYQNAVTAQSAVNVSGLVLSLSKVVKRLWDEPDCTGTGWVNRHPIVVLYAAQIAYLSGLGSVLSDSYKEALDICEEKGGVSYE